MNTSPTISVVSGEGGFYVEVSDGEGRYNPAWFPTRDEAEQYAKDCRSGVKDPYEPGETYL